MSPETTFHIGIALGAVGFILAFWALYWGTER